MKRIISILLYMAVLLPLAAQPPKHEVRAAWITAVYGLDWPQTRTTSPEGIRKQQAELIEILDRLKAANFNTVLFQTRTRGRCPLQISHRALQLHTDRKGGRRPRLRSAGFCHSRMPQARYGVPCLDGDHPSGQPQACSRPR